MTLIPAALAPISSLVQENALQRYFLDALFPNCRYRGLATRELYAGNSGEYKLFTRSALFDPVTAPLTPGVDPLPTSMAAEQWGVQLSQWGNTTDVSLAQAAVAIPGVFANHVKLMGLNAAQSLNRLARNALFRPYLAGETMTIDAGVATTSIHVASLNGFTEAASSTAVRHSAVSPTNTKVITIAGVGTAILTGATPDDPLYPYGPGVLTVSVAQTFGANVKITAADASTILRADGAGSIDEINEASAFNLGLLRNALATLDRRRIGPHPDGTYHLHIDPMGYSQMYADNALQRLLQGVPDHPIYQRYEVHRLFNTTVVTNNESPTDSVESVRVRLASRGSGYMAPDLGCEMSNASGVPILRAILTGGGALMEHYLDESAYMSDAGMVGKVGDWGVISNNGLSIVVDGVRLVLRGAMDRMLQVASCSWSATLGYGVPSDLRSQGGPRYKRAVVMEFSSIV